VAWWSFTGLAISQIAVSWPGQGLYNGVLMIGFWVAYRSLIWPVRFGRTFRGRCVDALTTGPAVLAFGLLLGAAGLLPRLHISSVSNIPNGDYAGVVGGNYLVTPHSFVTLLRDTFVDDARFRPVALGGVVVILAMFALLIGRNRHGIPFFAAIVVIASVLSMGETPLHRVFYVLPEFENLHTHSPRRMLWVSFVAPAILAGAGMEVLRSWRPERRVVPVLGIPLLLMIGAALIVDRAGFWVGWWPLLLATATTALAALLVMTQQSGSQGERTIRARLAVAAMITLIVAHPAAWDMVATDETPDDLLVAIDEIPVDLLVASEPCLETFLSRTDPGGAGEFLQQQQRAGLPFRYVGYAGRDPSTKDPSYTTRRCEPGVLSAGIGGRAVALDLESIQGYNPLHLGVYAEYTDVMNGGQQNYHWVDPYPATVVSSSLLDLLNVRYIVVSLGWPHGQNDARAIGTGKTEVFRNEQVVIFENPDAFSRAWIVHEVRPNNDGEGLRQLADGTVDGHEVAFIDGAMPDVEPVVAADAGDEHVAITGRNGDTLTAEVRVHSAGLVVFSEIYEQGWTGYLDGDSVEILRTDHALRGVAVPAGEHTIELRYEPESLRIGLWISLVTSITVAIVWVAAIRQTLIGARRRSSAKQPDG
ncbi:MAG: YfhO family protein, partial [Chloroflexota bacterium]|nr:YfhO family protein [Chloroflexota bacterium]